MKKPKVFNPLDKVVLGETVVEALLAAPSIPLESVEKFRGAGIYALYYSGSFKPYKPLADSDTPTPIYVGKAVPKGKRKGIDLEASRKTEALFKRLIEHAKSIEAAQNLSLSDFSCQIILVDEIWIGLGESLVIQRFKPLWNTVVEGFGNHDPGNGRYKGKCPLWDEFHSGRAWAKKCQPPKLNAGQIKDLVQDYFEA